MLRGAPLLLLFRAGGGSEPPTPTAPSRQVYSAEDIAESESLLNTFEDKSTLTFTPDADSDYVIFWSCEIQSTNTGRAVEAELWDDTATARMQASLKRVERVGDYNSIQGFHIASFGASPVSQTYKIRWRGETVGSTYRIRNARLVALKLVDGDEWASNTVSATQLSNEILADHSSLTFTPATAGDYLLLGTGMYSRSGVASLVRMQLVEHPHAPQNTLPIALQHTDCGSMLIRYHLQIAARLVRYNFRQMRTVIPPIAQGVFHPPY
jgi:hypothetical protein